MFEDGELNVRVMKSFIGRVARLALISRVEHCVQYLFTVYHLIRSPHASLLTHLTVYLHFTVRSKHRTACIDYTTVGSYINCDFDIQYLDILHLGIGFVYLLTYSWVINNFRYSVDI